MEIKQLEQLLKEQKQPSYRLEQAVRSYYQELQDGWGAITPWPKALRDACASLSWSPLAQVDIAETEKPKSVKFVFKTSDNLKIETVVMRHDDGRNTVCVSSQVGCAMACSFCATGQMGLSRNLTTEEIVDQVIQAARWLKGHDAKVTNIVYMGMGEPFHNPEAVFESLEILMDPKRFGLGARHISISTCGIVPGIKRLMEEAPQVNLAISLHAPTQMLREELMPVANAYPLERLMSATWKYTDKTNRKVMFEYLLIDGMNDGLKQADQLAELLKDHKHLSHVNLIKYHDTGEYKASPDEQRRAFQDRLRHHGISVTHRISFGETINAACGQLAGKARREVK